MLQAQWHWQSAREGRARKGRGAGRGRESVYLIHRHLPVAADGLTEALLVDPRVRACAAAGVRRRRHIGPPSRTTTNAAAAASTLRTRRRALWKELWRAWCRTWPSGPGRRMPSSRRHHRRGATGQLSGIWLGLWASASRGAALSASMLITKAAHA